MLYVLTQPERDLPSNRYGIWTTQHMYDQKTSVELSHSSPRCTQLQVSVNVKLRWFVDSLSHYKHVLCRRAIHNTKCRMYMMFGDTIVAEVSGL